MALDDYRFVVDGPGEMDIVLCHFRREAKDFSFASSFKSKSQERLRSFHCIIKSSEIFWSKDVWWGEIAKSIADFERLKPAWDFVFSREINEILFLFTIESPNSTFGFNQFRFYYSLKKRKGIVISVQTREGNKTFI